MLTDLSAIPEEPPPDLLYTHKVRFVDAIRSLWAHREIIYTLAERDFRSQYKQATLRATYGSRMEPAPVVVKRIEPGSTLPGGSAK